MGVNGNANSSEVLLQDGGNLTHWQQFSECIYNNLSIILWINTKFITAAFIWNINLSCQYKYLLYLELMNRI